MHDAPVHIAEPVRAALADARAVLRATYGDRPQQLIVFGSQARGEARPESDVDLLVVLGGAVNPLEEARRTSELVVDVASQYGVALSLLHMNNDDFGRDRLIPRAARQEGFEL